MENTFVLIFSLFGEYDCLMEQQNTRLPNAIVFFFFVFFCLFFFFTKLLIYLFVSF